MPLDRREPKSPHVLLGGHLVVRLEEVTEAGPAAAPGQDAAQSMSGTHTYTRVTGAGGMLDLHPHEGLDKILHLQFC